MNYIGIIHKEKGSDFGVSFPDFPGCITAGSTLEEAKDMAHEALAGHIEVMREHGEDIPAPTSLDEIMHDPDFTDGAVIVVSVAEVDETVRFNVTAPRSALARIDAAAEERGMTRSAYLVKSALVSADDDAANRTSRHVLLARDPKTGAFRERAQASGKGAKPKSATRKK